MNKLLSLLASFGLIATGSSAVVACGSNNSAPVNPFGPKVPIKINKCSYDNNHHQIVLEGSALERLNIPLAVILRTSPTSLKGIQHIKNSGSTPNALIIDVYVNVNGKQSYLPQGTYSIIFPDDNKSTYTFTVDY